MSRTLPDPARHRAILAAVLVTVALAAPVLAKDSGADPGSANDIVVTARHRNERSQDVPLAISAVTGAELATNAPRPRAASASTSRLHLTGYWDVAYRSGTNFINPLSAYGWQPGYALVNAGIGLKSQGEGTRLLFWSKNLFNTFYATAITPATANTPVTEVFGDPRSYGATLSHTF